VHIAGSIRAVNKKGNAAIFFAIDHCSLELVGIHAAKRGTRFEVIGDNYS